MQNLGFSLIELLIVVCISAILASVGINHWQAQKLRNELEITTKQLASFLSEVQVKAYTNNDNYYLYLFVSPWCISITQGEKPQSCHQGLLQFIKPDNSVVISGLNDNQSATFWGRRNMAKNISFELSNRIGTSKIFVSSQGRIRFCRKSSYLTGLPPC
ncbi:prepilin-type N-terminal cleavage/methylation domain-containing protein [Gilliamella sp. ESL0405]|uniref:prepilin-type N-terminal cleavage/methylation domain-containing protein n=1 Tax=Gilliamella sp. ESL0405 TaxID=2704653 RepID=UPI001C6A53E8|nr:prepilin-type N-terminal cleavage/methylation domain-containing protein [Gilliamella sp. ESL0405]QYN47243.1 prepilin-type N-terminal cleavage/methylation domain-containing protein [Gilliamella sp. ESL0405]